jgi:hypothetical protein
MAKSIESQIMQSVMKPSPSQVLGRTATVIRLLEEAGLPFASLQLIIDDPEKRRRLVQYWQAGLPNIVGLHDTSPIQLRSLPDPRKSPSPVYDARGVNALLSLGYTEKQIMDFWPPPDALPGFLTFFDPGWDILRLRRFCGSKGKIFTVLDWYADEAFAKVIEEPRYRQIRLKAVEDSFNLDFASQVRELSSGEEVPPCRVIIMGMVIYFLLSGERLFERYSVRCLDKDSDGGRVNVGRFGSDGFHVGRCWDDLRHDNLGLASSVPSRKS